LAMNFNTIIDCLLLRTCWQQRNQKHLHQQTHHLLFGEEKHCFQDSPTNSGIPSGCNFNCVILHQSHQ
jgi:hypothetical protein